MSEPSSATLELRALFAAGREHYMREDLPAAEAAFRKALAMAPAALEVRIALGTTLLKLGRLNEGFPLFDVWRQLPSRRDAVAPALPFPRWRGQDVAGKRVLVWSEDGFGDQIMYARFAALLKARGAAVTWLCPPPLARLFSQSLGVHAVASDRPVELAGFDFYCPSSALPLGFDLNLETLPAEPYLAPPSATPQDRTIGVMTAGNPKNVQGRGRELPPDLAATLLDSTGGVSLAPADTGARDFHDTAAIIAGLDLVITVDTAVAHLAGALGKPVWILLPRPADWRWLASRTDSPWYPSARLFRQTAPGDWQGVVDGVIGSLGGPTPLHRAGS